MKVDDGELDPKALELAVRYAANTAMGRALVRAPRWCKDTVTPCRI